MKATPFPGMDPWLELHCGDVHHRLVQYAGDALQTALPEDLRARVEERIFVEDEHERSRAIIPDVVVSQIDDLDHTLDLEPPLSAEEAAWVRDLLQTPGGR